MKNVSKIADNSLPSRPSQGSPVEAAPSPARAGGTPQDELTLSTPAKAPQKAQTKEGAPKGVDKGAIAATALGALAAGGATVALGLPFSLPIIAASVVGGLAVGGLYIAARKLLG